MKGGNGLGGGKGERVGVCGWLNFTKKLGQEAYLPLKKCFHYVKTAVHCCEREEVDGNLCFHVSCHLQRKNKWVCPPLGLFVMYKEALKDF